MSDYNESLIDETAFDAAVRNTGITGLSAARDFLTVYLARIRQHNSAPDALTVGRAIDDASSDYKERNKGYMHGGEYLTELGEAALAIIMGEPPALGAEAIGAKVPHAPSPASPSEISDIFDRNAELKNLTEEEREILKRPIVQSLLYEINLLPEQITNGKHLYYMLSVIAHMDQASKPKPVMGGRFPIKNIIEHAILHSLKTQGIQKPYGFSVSDIVTDIVSELEKNNVD